MPVASPNNGHTATLCTKFRENFLYPQNVGRNQAVPPEKPKKAENLDKETEKGMKLMGKTTSIKGNEFSFILFILIFSPHLSQNR